MSNRSLFHHVPDLPTCLLCVCLTGSVYCEEVDPDMTSVPALPKETAYLYARYNKIKKITAKDFGDIGAFLLSFLRNCFIIGNLPCLLQIETSCLTPLGILM